MFESIANASLAPANVTSIYHDYNVTEVFVELERKGILASYNVTLPYLFVALSLALVVLSAKPAVRWLQGVEFLLKGPSMLKSRYISGKTFSIRTPERHYVVISAKNTIQELSRAPEEQLSLVAVAEEIFQPNHTMNGVELSRLGMQRKILRTLSLKLSYFENALVQIIQSAFNTELDVGKVKDGWTCLSTFAMTKNVVGKANILTFYGEELTHDSEFLAAALQYPQDVFMAAEALRCIPVFLASFGAMLVTRWHKAQNRMMESLKPLVEARLEAKERGDKDLPVDYVQWIIDQYPNKIPNRAVQIVKQTLALWFASVHQPAMTLVYALNDLCLHPEYLKPLRDEISENLHSKQPKRIDDLPLLDSFFKESARMNPSETVSMRRKALSAHTFSDGTHVAAGDWACVPQGAMMRDANLYDAPAEFDGFRFARMLKDGSRASDTAKYTDLNPTFTFWGFGKQACPGRFYAAFIMKTIFTHIIHNYDLKLADPSNPRTFTWRTGVNPSQTSTLMVRSRQSL